MRRGRGRGLGFNRGGGGAAFTPDSIAGLSAWFDASDISTLTLDNININEWRCKKTGKYVRPVSTDTKRPTYNSVTKAVSFNSSLQQSLQRNGFFTDAPFYSTTNGADQAFTVVYVAGANLNVSIGATNTGLLDTYVRAGGSTTYGGAFTIPICNGIMSLIKPSSSTLLRLLQNLTNNTNIAYSELIPSPIVYSNADKVITCANTYGALYNGTTFSTGTLDIGVYGSSIYYNSTIKELIIYDRAITEADLLALISSLKTKWGI